MRNRGTLYLLILGLISCLVLPIQAIAQRNPPKIGLVLSGGGARGAAHIGILKVFEREKIPIDCIAATSFGALVGGLYSIGYSADDVERIFLEQDWNSIFSDAPQRRLTRLIDRRNARYQLQLSLNGWNPELPTGLWEGQRLTETMDILTTKQLLQAQYDFDKLPIPFRAVATNLVDGKAYVFKQGSMTTALRASLAIPLLFKPLEKDGMLLADGGLADNLPTDIARDMGADIVIAVDVTSPLLSKEKIRTFVDVVDQSISLQIERNVQDNRKLATIVLQPGLEKYSNVDFDKIPEIVKLGEESAKMHLEELKALVAGIPPHPHSPPSEPVTPVIDDISFRGLKQVRAAQLEKSLHVRPGEIADPSRIGADVGRLYATRLFDSVAYNLEPAGENRYHLVFNVKEAPLRTIGTGFRYDNDYNFVVLAEFTARQLFHSPSTATLSAQFGGLENHFASLRFTPSSAPFLFVEPRVEVRRLERQDIRDQQLVDKFTDKREAGQLMIGASIFRQLEISGGYRGERVEISGGSQPNRLAGSTALSGLTFRLNRDSLDSSDFPRSGTTVRAQFDKRSTSLGGDLDYSKLQVDYQRYFPISEKSTFRINAGIGYTDGPVPFYDLFFVGGYDFSEIGSRQFLGLDRDELRVRQMAILGAGYRRQFFSSAFSFVRRGFITGIYNSLFSSTREASPYHFELLNGVGVGLAFDTLLGPLRVFGGWGDGGRFHFYFSFGTSF